MLTNAHVVRNAKEVTVKLHRGHVMQKLGVTTLAELVRLEEKRRAGRTSGA